MLILAQITRTCLFFLLNSGKISRAVCADINEGPLNSARANAAEAGLLESVEFVLTDGAAALAGQGITDYTVCGMGGELIAAIIDRAPHLKDRNVNLILGPMSRQGVLRRYLAAEGFSVRSESYSCDGGKYYVTLLASYTGEAREIDDIEAEIGFKNAEYVNNSAQIGYLEAKLKAFKKKHDGMILGGEDAPKEKIIMEKIEEQLCLLRHS